MTCSSRVREPSAEIKLGGEEVSPDALFHVQDHVKDAEQPLSDGDPRKGRRAKKTSVVTASFHEAFDAFDGG